MTNNMADHHPGNSVAEGNHEGDFGCSMVELRNLMELRSAEAVARLNDSYGGVQNVCKRLKTSPVEGKRPSCEVGPPARVRPVPLGWSTRGSRRWLEGGGSNSCLVAELKVWSRCAGHPSQAPWLPAA